MAAAARVPADSDDLRPKPAYFLAFGSGISMECGSSPSPEVGQVPAVNSDSAESGVRMAAAYRLDYAVRRGPGKPTRYGREPTRGPRCSPGGARRGGDP